MFWERNHWMKLRALEFGTGQTASLVSAGSLALYLRVAIHMHKQCRHADESWWNGLPGNRDRRKMAGKSDPFWLADSHIYEWSWWTEVYSSRHERNLLVSTRDATISGLGSRDDPKSQTSTYRAFGTRISPCLANVGFFSLKIEFHALFEVDKGVSSTKRRLG